jgi:hypothetical protein
MSLGIASNSGAIPRRVSPRPCLSPTTAVGLDLLVTETFPSRFPGYISIDESSYVRPPSTRDQFKLPAVPAIAGNKQAINKSKHRIENALICPENPLWLPLGATQDRTDASKECNKHLARIGSKGHS